MVILLVERFADIAAFQPWIEVLADFTHWFREASRVINLARKRYQNAQRIILLLNISSNLFLPAYSLLAAADHYHCLGSTLQERLNVFTEVLDYDFDLLSDVVRVESNPLHNPLHRLALLDLLFVVFLAVVGELERELVGRIVLQDIKNETLFDCLAHRVDMERLRQTIWPWASKQLHRFGFWRGGESDIGQSISAGPRGHLGSEQILSANFAAVLQLSQLFGRQQLLQL